MSKFRQKPVIVEAQQWFPPGVAGHDPAMLSHRKGNQVNPPDYRQKGDIYCFAEGASPGMGGDTYFIRIGGANDNVQLKPGDWIVTGARGEKHVYKPEDLRTSVTVGAQHGRARSRLSELLALQDAKPSKRRNYYDRWRK